MATPYKPSAVRALVLPFGATVVPAESSYTEQGPRTGTPTATSTTALQLSGAGAQESGSNLELLVGRGGFPVRGEAGIVWRRSGDTDYYGCDVPSALWDFSTPESDALGTDAYSPHILTLSSGVVLVAYHYEASGSDHRVSVRAYSGGTWGSRVTVRSRTVGIRPLRPCLLQLPDGRILCFSWYGDSTELTIAVDVSTDDGATWSVHQRYALAEVLDGATYVGNRMRAAYVNGQICLVAELLDGTTYTIHQFGSDDLAATFYEAGAAWNGAKPEIWAWQGVFHVAYLAETFNNGALRRGGSAFDPLSGYEETELFGGSEAISIWSSATTFTEGELAICMADDGALWGYGLLVGIDHIGVVYRSLDGGATWESVGDSSSSAGDPSTIWWNPWTADAIYPVSPTVTWWRGQVLMATENSGSDRPDAIDVLHLGGMATVTLPPVQSVQRATRQVSWERAWVPFAPPSGTGWTTAGTGTSAFVGDIYQYSSTAGQARHNTIAPAGDSTEGLIVLGDILVTTGGSTAACACGAILRTANAGAGFEVELRFSTTQLLIRDSVAGTNLATLTLDGTTYPLMSGGVRFLAAISAEGLSVWLCARRTDERAWVLAVQSALSDDAGGGGTANSVRWGNPSAAIANSVSQWRQFHVVNDEYTGPQLAGGQDNPEGLFPLPLSSRPVYVADGAAVRGLTGPGAVGDSFTLDADADFSLSGGDLVQEASVQRTWRSVDDSANQVIAWQVDAVGPAYISGGAVLWIEGANWRTGSLEIYDGAAWTEILAVDLAGELVSLPFLLSGSSLTVDASSAPPGTAWLDRGELVGGTVDLGSGKLRRIIAQTEGTWSASGRLPVLTLADCDGTEPASGDCDIWQPRACLVQLPTSDDPLIQGYRITIDAQDTVTGDLRMKYLLGSIVPFPTHPDEGSDLEVSAPVEEIEEVDGTTYRRALGPRRRRMTWQWLDGLFESGIGGALPDPALVMLGQSTPAYAAAAVGSEARLLQALVEELDALATPVVAITHLPTGTPNSYHLFRRRHFLAGLIEGPIITQEIQGVARGADAELDGKLVTVQAVAIRELV